MATGIYSSAPEMKWHDGFAAAAQRAILPPGGCRAMRSQPYFPRRSRFPRPPADAPTPSVSAVAPLSSSSCSAACGRRCRPAKSSGCHSACITALLDQRPSSLVLWPPPIRLSTFFCWRPDCPQSAELSGLALQRLHREEVGRIGNGPTTFPDMLCRCPSLVIVMFGCWRAPCWHPQSSNCPGAHRSMHF